MKLAAWVSVADLISVQKTIFERFIIETLNQDKHNLFHKNPLSQVFRSLKKAGVDGMELMIPFYTTDENILEVKKLLNKYSLPVFSIHQSLDTVLNISEKEIVRLCDIARIFSATVIVIHSVSIDNKLSDKNFVGNLKKLQNKYKVKFAIENMPKNPLTIFRPRTWKTSDFSKVVKKSGFFITFDTTHLAQAGEDIVDFYNYNKEKIVNIHMSDYKKNWLNNYLLLQRDTHLPLKKGELPIDAFLKILKETYCSGLLTMEIESSLFHICKSARLIKKALK